MGLKVFIPYRRTAPASNHPQSDKSEERRQHALCIVHKVLIPGETAKLKMKLEIPIEHVWSTLRLGCPSHSIYDRLQSRKVRLRLRREICRKAFDRAAHLIELYDVLLSEVDDASASAAFLGDESVALQEIDRFSDG